MWYLIQREFRISFVLFHGGLYDETAVLLQYRQGMKMKLNGKAMRFAMSSEIEGYEER